MILRLRVLVYLYPTQRTSNSSFMYSVHRNNSDSGTMLRRTMVHISSFYLQWIWRQICPTSDCFLIWVNAVVQDQEHTYRRRFMKNSRKNQQKRQRKDPWVTPSTIKMTLAPRYLPLLFRLKFSEKYGKDCESSQRNKTK